MSSIRLAWGAALVAALLLGCGNVKVPGSLEELQQSAQNAAQSIGNTAQNAVNSASNAVKDPASVYTIEVNAGGQVVAPTCYASYVAPEGRGGLLHVSSYANPAAEGFPSIMIVATSTAAQATALKDQQVLGEVYVQNEKNGPIWKSPDNALATIKITAADASAVTGEILSGNLTNTATGESKPASGKFRASWRQ